jgi:transcriptional/translational regulatory protein YebC/TACO1
MPDIADAQKPRCGEAQKILEQLEENDDVKELYHNAEFGS